MFEKILPPAREVLKLLWYEKEEKCLLCGAKSVKAVCQICYQEYFRPSQKRCRNCGKLIGGPISYCRDCQKGKGPQDIVKVTALGFYHGHWKELIHGIKYRGQPYLLLALEEYITSWAIKELPPPDIVVPVPLHPSRLACRGYNQAEVLASILSRSLGITLKDALLRLRDTKQQTSLGRLERIHNLRGVFKLAPQVSVAGQTIWLVDDVITTGTTIGECAQVLRRSGADEIYALCLGAGLEEN
ncbi:MAG: phosphoribosyltransferase family protein [Desulfitobacteriia bacterium]